MMMATTKTILLLMMTGLTRSQQASGPVFVQHPRDDFSSTDLINFECRAEGQPKPQITWHEARSGQELVPQTTDPDQPGIHINQELGTLTITQAEQGAIFKVFCRARNSLGTTDSRSAQGGLAYLDRKFGLEPSSMVVRNGDTIMLECKPPAGMPPPSVVWIHNTIALGLNTSVDMPNLEIKDVRDTDSGLYVCRVQNAAGILDSQYAMLTVIARDLVQDSVRAHVGEEVKFECMGNRGSSILWRRFEPDQLIDQTRSTLMDDRLILTNVQRSDRGKYGCEEDHVVKTLIDLEVITKPGFILTPDNVHVSEGGKAVFHCRANHPEVAIYWTLPSGKPIFREDKFLPARLSLTEEGSLIISPVVRTDAGSYQCTAWTDRERTDSRAELTVEAGSPVVGPGRETDSDNYSPIIDLLPTDSLAVQGQEVLLPCEVHDSKQYAISWNRVTLSTGKITEAILMSQSFDNDRIMVLPNGALKFNPVVPEDTGNYTCLVESLQDYRLRSNWTARLRVGRVSVSEPLYRTKILPAPQNFRLQPTKPLALKLEWDPVHGPVLAKKQHYLIEMFVKENPENAWYEVTANQIVTDPVVEISGLDSNRTYYFLVRARYQDGRIGRASQPLGPIRFNAPTGIESESGSMDELLRSFQRVTVRDLDMVHLGSSQVRISWQIEGPSRLVGAFRLKYRPIHLLLCTSEMVGKNQGYCSLSNPYLKERLGYMQSPNGLDIAPNVTRVEYDGKSQQINTIVDLLPFHCYELEVEPVSIEFRLLGSVKGQSSAPKRVLTHENIPSEAPGALCAEWLNETTARLTWIAVPVQKWNGILTGFLLYINDDSEKRGITKNLSYKALETTLSDLHSQGPYFITISATNCRGYGVRSMTLTLQKPAQIGQRVGWGCGQSQSSQGDKSTGSLSGRYPFDVVMIGTSCAVILCLLIVVMCGYFICCKHRPLLAAHNKKNLASPLLTTRVMIPESGKGPSSQVNAVNGKFEMEPFLQMQPQMGAGKLIPVPVLVPQQAYPNAALFNMMQQSPGQFTGYMPAEEQHYATSNLYDNQLGPGYLAAQQQQHQQHFHTPHAMHFTTTTTTHSSSSGGGGGPTGQQQGLEDCSFQDQLASSGSGGGGGKSSHPQHQQHAKGSGSSAGSSYQPYGHVSTGMVDVSMAIPRQFQIPPPPRGPPPPCPQHSSYCEYDATGAVYDPADEETEPEQQPLFFANNSRLSSSIEQ